MSVSIILREEKYSIHKVRISEFGTILDIVTLNPTSLLSFYIIGEMNGVLFLLQINEVLDSTYVGPMWQYRCKSSPIAIFKNITFDEAEEYSKWIVNYFLLLRKKFIKSPLFYFFKYRKAILKLKTFALIA